MRPARTAAVTVVTVVAALLLGLTAIAPSQAATKITPRNFGIHSYTTDPNVPAGTFRMSCWPMWRQVETARGVYNWGMMDLLVAQVEKWGFTDIQFTFCGTPEWAAGKVKDPLQEIPSLGKGSTAPPARLSDWTSFVTRVVQRYRGRIDSYQVWNEITSPQFYQGSAATMVAMTRSLSAVVRRHGRGAKVVGASLQTHRPDRYRSMGVPYLTGLKRAGWPVHVVAGHFYPAAKGGPNERVQQIKMFARTMRALRAPKRVQTWDTEGNFWTAVRGNPAAGRVRGTKAAIFVARNYLDSWRLGLPRSYWYLWSNEYVPFAGVQLRERDAGTKAYRTLGVWTIGATLSRCRETGRLVTCSFRKGKPFVIAFTTSGRATMRFGGTKQVCPVTGGKCSSAKRKVAVTALPVKIG